MAITFNILDSVGLDETAGQQEDDTTNTLPGPLDALGTEIETAKNLVFTVESDGDLGDLSFVDANGVPLDGVAWVFAGNPVTTLDGNQIFFYSDPSNNNLVIGREGDGTTANESGDIVVGIFLEEDRTVDPVEGTIWTALYEPISHPLAGDGTTPPGSHNELVDLTGLLHVAAAETQAFSFANAPAGANLFMAFTNAGANLTDGIPEEKALVITGRDPADQSGGDNVSSGDTVNSSGATDTTLGTNGQQVKAGDGLYVTYVAGMNESFVAGPGNNLSPTEALVEANIDFNGGVIDASGAEFLIAQVTPTGQTLSIKITAYTTDAEPGVDFVNGLGDADDVAVEITGVTVNGEAVAFAVDGDGVIVAGIGVDDLVAFTTDGDHNRVLIENAQPTSGPGSNRTFDLGGFAIAETTADSVEVGSRLDFFDDGPAIDLAPVAEASIVLDESVGADANDPNADDETAAGAPAGAIGYATAAAGTLFTETADAGTDGDDKVYSLVLSAGATGLTDTASGEAVVLSQPVAGGTIEGRTATGGDLVLTIEVDGSTGDVEVAQFRALDHGADLNDHDSAVSMNPGLVELQATLTDGDHDFASDKIELGSLIDFEDDGPTIDLEPVTDVAIVVDESAGADANDPNADDEANANAPLGAIGYAEITAANLFTETADAGSDGEASTVYSLVLNAGATGLTDTASGEAVVLVDNGGVIEGRTETGGDLVLTIEVDASTGDVEVAQFRALDHGDDGNDHDSAVSMNAGLVELQATLTDGDTDFASDSFDLGELIEFEDDGPAIDLTPLNPTIAVDESVGTTGSSQDEPGNAQPDDETNANAPVGAIGYTEVSATSLFSENADAGQDGEDSTAYSLVLTAGATGLTDTTSGEAVVLVDNTGVIEGRTATSNALVFTIAVDATSGNVEVAQFRALDHGDDLNDHDSAVNMSSGLVELQATLTDGDTDLASDKIELGSLIDFEDDGPAVTVEDSSGTFVAAAGSGLEGDWSDLSGEDGFKSLNINFDSYTIDGNSTVAVDASLGTETTTDANGNYVFTGSIEDDFNGDGTDEEVSFELRFNPATDKYEFELTTPPTTVITFDTTEGSLSAGGPASVRTLLRGDDGEGGNDDIVFFAANATAQRSDIEEPPPYDSILDLVERGADDLTEAEIEALLPLDGLIDAGATLNVSSAGIGFKNNILNGADEGSGTGAFANTSITAGDQSFVVNPETVVDEVTVYVDNSVGGYTPATEDLYYTLYFTDGSTSGPTKVTQAMLIENEETNNPGDFFFELDGGDKQIDALQLTMGKGTAKIQKIAFTVEQAFDPQPLALDFTATLVDGDDDSSSDPFSVDLDDGAVA